MDNKVDGDRIIFNVNGKDYLIIRDRYLSVDELVRVAREVGVIHE